MDFITLSSQGIGMILGLDVMEEGLAKPALHELTLDPLPVNILHGTPCAFPNTVARHE